MPSRFVQSEDTVVFSTADVDMEADERASLKREAQEEFDMQYEYEYALQQEAELYEQRERFGF